jgi:hypothetical protein
MVLPKLAWVEAKSSALDTGIPPLPNGAMRKRENPLNPPLRKGEERMWSLPKGEKI